MWVIWSCNYHDILLVTRARQSDNDSSALLQRARSEACVRDNKEVPDLMSYFPDFQANEVPDRSFMWSVVRTLRPETCKELLEKARKARSLDSEENKNELIEIHPDFIDKLLRIPNLPKSSTIMIAFAWFSYRQRKSCILA